MGCQHCGFVHNHTCPRVKAIEYYENGLIKRIEFNELATMLETHPNLVVIQPCPTKAKLKSA
jgi:hypothetical protein